MKRPWHGYKQQGPLLGLKSSVEMTKIKEVAPDLENQATISEVATSTGVESFVPPLGLPFAALSRAPVPRR